MKFEKTYVFLLLLVVAFCILRILWLEMPIHVDEGEAGYTSMLWKRGHLPYTYRTDLKGPIHFFLYLISMLFFGNTIIPIRIINDILFFASILVIFKLAEEWYGKTVGLISAFFYGLFMNTPALEGQLALAIVMSIPFTIFSVYLCNRFLSTYRKSFLFFSGICISLTFLTQEDQSIFILLLIFMIIVERHGSLGLVGIKNSIKDVVKNLSLLSLGVIIPITMFVGYYLYNGVFSYLLEYQHHLFTGNLAAAHSHTIPFNWAALSFLEISPILLMSMLGCVVCLSDLRKNKNRTIAFWLILSLTTIIVKNKYFGHNLITAIPAASILSGVALNLIIINLKRKNNRKPKQNVLSVFIVAMLISSFFFSIPFQIMQYPNYGLRWENDFLWYPQPLPYSKIIELTDYLRFNSANAGNLLVDGWIPYIYWLSGIEAPSVNLDTFHLDMPLSMSTKEYQNILSRVKAKDFEFIVISYPVPYWDHTEGIAHYTPLNYFFVKRTNYTSLWPEKFVMLYSKYNEKGEYIFYNFIQQLENSTQEYSISNRTGTLKSLDDPVVMPRILSIAINNDTRDAILQHPPNPPEISNSYIMYDQIHLPPSKNISLRFGIAISPIAWDKNGDGVIFSILLGDGEETTNIFSKYIDPRINVNERKWLDYEIDLSNYGGKTISICFVTNSNHDVAYDSALWSEPSIIVKR